MRRPAALVLTAGLGTRLRPLTYVRAKAAVPVNGEPLARRVSRWLASHGFTDQVFNLHHLPHTVSRCLGDGSDIGVRLRYSWEQPVLGSAGGPRHALPLLTEHGDRILIVNGDTLTNVDLDALLAAHDRGGALVTMAVIPNPAPDKYGGVVVGSDGTVERFSRRGEVRDAYHFIGLQVCEARVFADLPDGVPHESVGVLYPAMMRAQRGSVAAFVCDALFRDIGTAADYLQTSLELAAEEGDRLVSPAATVTRTAVLERSAVWDDVTVGAHASLVNCVVADGAHVPDGSQFEGCAIVAANGRAPAAGERIEGGLLIRSLHT